MEPTTEIGHHRKIFSSSGVRSDHDDHNRVTASDVERGRLKSIEAILCGAETPGGGQAGVEPDQAEFSKLVAMV